ncbi:MAG: HlyD family secretion protein [Pirellulaceae bacterium]
MMWRIILVVLVGCGLTALLLYSQTRQEPLHVSGYIEADEIRLGSRVGGRVEKVLVEEGAQVEPGEVLLQLEEFDLDEREAQARAELAARTAEYNRLVAGFRLEEQAQAAARVERIRQKLNALIAGPREEEIEAARARVRLAQAQLDLAESTNNRNVALVERDPGAVSRDTLDRSIEDLRVAKANLDVRQQELQLLEKGTRAEDIAAAKAELAEAEQAHALTRNGARPEEIEQAKAAADAARAALAVLLAMREELTVKTPVKAVVEAVELQPGDLVAAGAPVLSLIDMDHLWVRAYVPENRMGLAIGTRLRVTVDSFPDRSFTGVVTFMSRQAEFTPSNVQTPEERSKQVFRIKVDVASEGALRPGMAADVWLEPLP